MAKVPARARWIPVYATLGLHLIGSPSDAADPGFRFGRTGLGTSLHLLDDQVPSGIAAGKSKPWGFGFSQEFYSGKGFDLRLDGDWAWQDDQESCIFCDDFSANGHYFWKTRYASVGLRISPRTGRFWDGFGLEAGYARFLYRWGISEMGWDSPYPSGNFLVGEYLSHQLFLGANYDLPFHLGPVPLAVELGGGQTLASRNTFTPKFIRNPGNFPFPSHPLAFYFTLKWER